MANMVHHWTMAPHVKKSAEEASSPLMMGQLHTGEAAGSTAGSSVEGVRGPRQRKRIQNEGM